MTQIIDQLAMLLSTDWFAGKWCQFGMKSNSQIREAMKKKCRAIVSQLLDGESDYWSISFDDGRIRRTYDSFFSAATDSKLDASDIEFLRQIADQTPVEIKESETIALLNSLTELLVADSSPEVAKNLSEDTITIVISIYTATSMIDIDFVALCVNSNTDWDMKLREMTSGLPEYLADFATDICEQRSHFVQFWAQLVENISENELKNLRQWYSNTALELTQRNLEFPRWM
jgi:hypothetical protein